MDDWRVDPDGVIGVLAGVDEQGPVFVSVHDEVTALAAEGGLLSVDGRDAVASAWNAFFAERSLVPGKLMRAINSAAGAVSAATVAVITGDDEMSDDQYAAQQHAEDAWGIAIPAAYQSPEGYY